MSRAILLPCFAVVAFFSAAVTVSAQEQASNLFGEAPQLAPQPAESPFAEKSVLQQGIPSSSEPVDDFCQCVRETSSPTVAKIEKALTSRMQGTGFEFTDTPLEEVANLIQDEYGIPVQLDRPALDEIGIGPDEKITISISGISLRSALRLMFTQLQLTYIIQNEVLMITTPEAADQELIICVYDVNEIVGPAKDQSVDQLIDAIVSCVATDTWAENGGGEAEIRWLKPGFLIVSQTQAVHDEVRALIATIRDVRKRAPNQGAAADSAAAAEDNGVTTRYYPLKLNASANPGEVRLQIHNLITDSLPDERWKGKLADGQPVVLTILPDRVIVRHKATVQEKVEALLTDSGLVATPERRGGTFGGGGFGRGERGGG